MFVVVVIFLDGAKYHIVVPQEFVYGLSQQNLNNYGKNKHKFTVYWSKEVSESENGLAGNHVPDFTMEKSACFPPIGNAACYDCKLKYFFGK